MKNQTFQSRSRVCLGVMGLMFTAVSASWMAAPAAFAQSASGNVTLNLQNAPIQTVLKNLFKSAGKNFTMDQNVYGNVTVDVNGVPFDTALQAVLSGTNPPLEAPLVGGIYHVQVQQQQRRRRFQPSNVSSNSDNTPTAPANNPEHAYLIPIAHTDASYLAYMIAAFSQKNGPPVIVPSAPDMQQQSMMGGGMMGGGMGGGMMGGGMGGGMMGGMGGGMMGGMGGGMMGGMGGGMMGGGMGGGMMGGGMGGYGGIP